MAILLSSPAFSEGSEIPARHTCDGPNLSPPLHWHGVPEGARTLALIVEDPDAPSGTFVHWVLFDLPATVTELAEGIPTTETLPSGARQGRNDFRRVGYAGPCPPRGSAHRYFFKIYALDGEVSLRPGATGPDLLRAAQGHVLAESQLMGRYKRRVAA